MHDVRPMPSPPACPVSRLVGFCAARRCQRARATHSRRARAGGRPQHSLRLEKFMKDIMATLLVEMDTVSQPLLDAVLENLVEPKKTERPASHALARSLIKRCVKQFVAPVHTFLQSCLPSSIILDAPESELRDEWPQLILELITIDHELVGYVLPQLQELVAMEDENVRVQGPQPPSPCCAAAASLRLNCLGRRRRGAPWQAVQRA
jgi:hypothetical protein